MDRPPSFGWTVHLKSPYIMFLGSSGLQSPMVAEGFSGGLNVKRASATLLSEQQLEDVIEATATKVCKVNRLQEMFG